MKDPISKCECITVLEFIAIYQHVKGKDCVSESFKTELPDQPAPVIMNFVFNGDVGNFFSIGGGQV